MSQQKPTLALLLDKDPARIITMHRALGQALTERAEIQGIDLPFLDNELCSIASIGDFQIFIGKLHTKDREGMALVLSYPLSFLLDPSSQNKNGLAKYRKFGKILKNLEYAIDPPFLPETPMTFEAAQTLAKLIVHEDYGEKDELEKRANTADWQASKENWDSYSRSLFLLCRLAWLKAREHHPKLA